MLKTCTFCSQEFQTSDSRRKFCNRSCSSSYNGSAYPKRKKAQRICAGCKEPKDLRKNALYCSPTCKSVNLIMDWLAGNYDPTTKYGLSTLIRNYLLEEANHCCQECGWSGVNPVSKKSTLQVDHVDGKWYNNKRENLKVLCPNCHSLTPNYGALNKGSGRTFRYSAVV